MGDLEHPYVLCAAETQPDLGVRPRLGVSVYWDVLPHLGVIVYWGVKCSPGREKVLGRKLTFRRLLIPGVFIFTRAYVLLLYYVRYIHYIRYILYT